tara:strand:- start:93 stop:302 length:210 start_codon:yes stop_codon:yes gene_type:complete
MEKFTDAIGNSITLALERIFWLGLGVYFFLAILTSLIRGNKERKERRSDSPKELENIPKNLQKKTRNLN